jgi:uncharacterized heparinase superfamily protein
VREPSLTGRNEISFLNQPARIDTPACWNDPRFDKLWLYNLHYFDDLNAWEAQKRGDWHRALIARWIAENPPGFGNGWEPYPTSLRIVNWIQWILAGNQPSEAMHHSLAVQARWLRRNLEYHLLGNHLLVNAKALCFAGLYFAGTEGERWWLKGRALLNRELPEQILPDGGHFERSPMYHLLVLEDMLDVLNIHAAYGRHVSPEWVEAGERMLVAVPVMVHPDGEVAFFNDATIGVAPPPTALFEYAERLGLNFSVADSSVAALPKTGYYRLASGPAMCLADVAPIEPNHLPGHAHADTLSFEFSLDGLRFFVNSGTSVYGTGGERLRQRGTAAHNTVMVDGQDSSEVWNGFRVARRAYPFGVAWGIDNDTLWLRGAHDGYRRLATNQLHYRSWRLEGNALVVADELTERFSQATAQFYLHPDVEVVKADERGAHLRSSSGRQIKFKAKGGALRVEPSTYHPEFGLSLANQKLVVDFQDQHVECRVIW